MPTIHSRIFDRHVADVYRFFNIDRDNNGDYKGCRLIISGMPCNRHSTDNFDDSSPVGYYKRQGIMVSDRLTFDNTYDLRPEDYIYFSDDETWYRAAGDHKKRYILGRSKVYLTLSPDAPAII